MSGTRSDGKGRALGMSLSKNSRAAAHTGSVTRSHSKNDVHAGVELGTDQVVDPEEPSESPIISTSVAADDCALATSRRVE